MKYLKCEKCNKLYTLKMVANEICFPFGMELVYKIKKLPVFLHQNNLIRN